MWDSIRSRCGKAAADADRWAFFGVGAGAPVDRHLTRHQRAVFLDAGLGVDNGFVARECRDKGFFPVELHAHGAAVGVKGEGHCYRFDFESALRAETAALQRIDKANFFFGHAERFGDLVQRAERCVVGHPDGQPTRLFIELSVGRVRLHGGMLNDRHEVALFDD